MRSEPSALVVHGSEAKQRMLFLWARELLCDGTVVDITDVVCIRIKMYKQKTSRSIAFQLAAWPLNHCTASGFAAQAL